METNEVSDWNFVDVPKWNQWDDCVAVSGDVGFVAAVVELAIDACFEDLGIVNDLLETG
jgi:hypothetical protein